MTENGGLRSCGESTGGTAQLRLEGPSRDDLFESLADARRRRSLAYLRAEEGVVSVEELAKHVAAAERTGGERVSPSDRKQVATSLYHVHLPKLIDSGLVSWQDPNEREMVRATDLGQSLSTELSWMPTNATGDD
ncbi:DUF7344 domain-containing protein [Halorientalis salina]|uniref:DUF7344 domain-containing protein n=1 Tax=Halorientalis salina TaxID=2932266 RepID=UPI0010AC3D77|nr:hypothetical protein [Halorientalis salina]